MSLNCMKDDSSYILGRIFEQILREMLDQIAWGGMPITESLQETVRQISARSDMDRIDPALTQKEICVML